eukprot:PITA_27638
MDVKSAFLNGELEEEVYIEQLEGFLLSEKEDYVCRLKKALYGLKQAPRAWYARLDGYLRQKGFKKGTIDSNLYVQIDKDNLRIIEVYVDDIIFGSNDDQLSCKLSIGDASKDVDQRLYISMIGSLLYVTASQQDVMQAVGQVARFQAAPKQSHIIIVKRILQYLKGTTKYGLWYPKGNNLIIQAFTDVDWAGSIDDCKSTSGAAFYLGGCLISWLSKKKTSISLSTTEVEYIAADTCCTQVLWVKKTCQDLQVKFDEPIAIFCDNTNAISISKNLVMYSKMKPISIKYHFVREKVTEKNIKLEYVGTKEKIVDIFTKPLPREAFEYFH